MLLHDRKTTLPGLREAFDAQPDKPPDMAFRDYSALSGGERATYDEAREDYMRLSLRVSTPEQDLCIGIVRKLMSANPRRKNSRRGLMISAPMFHGKTELALMLARSVEHHHRSGFPDYLERGEVPVVWVEMTEHSTGKALFAQIVEFLCPTITIPRQMTTDRLRKMAVELLAGHRTKLLVIDEAHKLGGSEPSSMIKALQNESSATVVLVGIHLQGKAFGSGDGQQVTSRCDIVTIERINIKTEDGRKWWVRWVATFDRNLPLCGHRPGLLTLNAALLHRAARGQLAVLALIVERLVTTILLDDERYDEDVTKQRLFEVLTTLRATTSVTDKNKIRLDDILETS
ncbi:TniB family NTP-binding protein [Microbacterium sp. LEMMJ01]|uniref:TniB family NTP-binding protein n=1 Tax=Microbacterium sp. LEMMJ01 TaxID=1978350 RepID=UPI000A1ECEAB|nr:TniB family NTP-binding protein [Microbacterium sp. LEMMJ01]OSP08809.1 hypothetical protein B7W94_04040 [Microbacterium sp. LEMMJ01]